MSIVYYANTYSDLPASQGRGDKVYIIETDTIYCDTPFSGGIWLPVNLMLNESSTEVVCCAGDGNNLRALMEGRHSLQHISKRPPQGPHP